ncbi:hypothetical protein O1611_g9130 [Lasiodiplodia mahajangana]|uniref:Uncharacterized protein n=1 Tax=Lasiodiplodia mahajangana TaxID=1108764 RepID=A0ACC2JAR5_9PEZI|nr:hypothetical protein O1611_g9130 [Lasiodiplodia mahajangana]
MDSFEYRQLDLKSSAFRLVQLFNGVKDEEIQCELIYTTLDANAISYEAVSYTWGSSDRTCNIKVEGRNLRVTSNLWNLLRDIRQAEGDRYLWIDAISINQEDDIERGHQVQRMETIYSGAERVLFYLGDTNEEITIFMDTLYNFQRQTLYFHPTSVQGWEFIWEVEQAEARKRYGDSTGDILRRGLQELLNRPWFRRVWILQEVAKARKGLLCCGTASIHAQIFAMSPRLLGAELDRHSRAVFQLMPTYERKPSREPQHADLYSLLVDYGASEASDSRDKIFALLGFCADERISDFVMPNYTHDEPTVVRAVVTYFLTRGFSTSLRGLPPLDWLSSVKVPPIRRFFSDLASFPRDITPQYMEKSFIYMLGFWPVDALRDFIRKRGIGAMVTPELVDIAISNQFDAVQRMGVLLRYGRRFNMEYFVEFTLSDIAYDVLYRYLGAMRLPRRPDKMVVTIYRFLSLMSGNCILNYMSMDEFHTEFPAFPLMLGGNDRKKIIKNDDDGDGDEMEGKADGAKHYKLKQFRKWASLTIAILSGGRCEVTLPLDTESEKFDPRGLSATMALHFAMYRGHVATTRYLLEKGVQIVIGSLPNALPWVVYRRDPYMMDVLRERPESIVGLHGRPALHSAAEFETIPVIRFLLDHGADANAVDYLGETAAYIARKDFRYNVLDVLDAAGNGRLHEFDETMWKRKEKEDLRETMGKVLRDLE